MKIAIRDRLKLPALLTGAAALAAAPEPARAQAAGASLLDEVLARGKVKVGVTSESPPFGFIDDSGTLVGFDIDIAKLVGKTLFGDDRPERVEFVRQGFAARWTNAQNGTIDFGIQVTTILPDRIIRVGFTEGYIDSGIVMVVRANSPIQSFADLNNSRYTTAVLTAPIQAERARRFFPQAQVITFDSIGAQFTAVRANRADAAQLDTPVAQWYLKTNPGFRILPDQMVEPTNNAIFLKLGDFKWWQVLNTMVQEMRGGSMFADYAAIHEKWLGGRPRHAKYYYGQT